AVAEERALTDHLAGELHPGQTGVGGAEDLVPAGDPLDGSPERRPVELALDAEDGLGDIGPALRLQGPEAPLLRGEAETFENAFAHRKSSESTGFGLRRAPSSLRA